MKKIIHSIRSIQLYGKKGVLPAFLFIGLHLLILSIFLAVLLMSAKPGPTATFRHYQEFSTPGTALPHITSCSAVVFEGKTYVKWKSDITDGYFFIERFCGEADPVYAGIKKAGEGSTDDFMLFIDRHAQPGKLHYRVSLVSKDGSIYESDPFMAEEPAEFLPRDY